MDSIFFLKGGMELYLKTLQTFPGETSIETKVLGLINNIAGHQFKLLILK
jgi:Zyg-11 family protein